MVTILFVYKVTMKTNDGLATVSAELLDSSDGSVAADDYATIEVDLVTAPKTAIAIPLIVVIPIVIQPLHIVPQTLLPLLPIIPPSDVTSSGCITLSGCYFGNDQDEEGSCTCTTLS